MANDQQSSDTGLNLQSTTIMFADVVESVRLIRDHQARYVARWRVLLAQLTSIVVAAHGNIIERRGDGLLITFGTPRAAAGVALRFHRCCQAANVEHPDDDTIVMRIGVHSAAVLIEDGSIFGDGVNVTARVASLAGPGETVFSDAARDGLTAGVDAEVEDLGDCFVKHLPQPIRAFRVGGAGSAPVLPSTHADADDLLPAVAVLQFAFNDEPQSRSVMDLFCESVSGALAHAPGLRVVAWLSSKALSTEAPDFATIGAKLGADWLLSGSVYLAGERVVINAQLIAAAAGEVICALREVESIGDLLQKESALVAAVSTAVVASIANAEAKRVARHALPTLAGHTLLLGAVGLMHRARAGDFDRSREALEHLLERQPRMHSARPWLAKWFLLRHTRGIATTTEADTRRALAETSRALDSHPNDAFALAMRGFIYFHLARDNALASDTLEHAIDLNPNEAMANSFLAAVTGVHGNFERSWKLASHALTLSPFDPLRAYMRMIASTCAFTSERYDEAVRLAQASIRESATHISAWRTLIIALVCANRTDEARQHVPKLMEVDPMLTVTSYRNRIQVPDPARARAIEALRVAGVREA